MSWIWLVNNNFLAILMLSGSNRGPNWCSKSLEGVLSTFNCPDALAFVRSKYSGLPLHLW